MDVAKSKPIPVEKPEFKRTPREAAALKKIQGEPGETFVTAEISQSLDWASDYPDQAAGLALLMKGHWDD